MNGNVHKWIAWGATAIFALFSIIGTGPSTYRFAIFFLGPLLWAAYLARKMLCIRAGDFAILAAAFVLHNIGAFGTYQKFYLGLEFDTYVHFFFGVAGGLIVAEALRCNFHFTGWKHWIGTVLLILGLSAIHELVEYGSTLILGGEKGMLKINDPDRFDTQKDLVHNLLGTLLALGWASFRSLSSGAKIGSPGRNSQ